MDSLLRIVNTAEIPAAQDIDNIGWYGLKITFTWIR
jgi:hypothetical protein